MAALRPKNRNAGQTSKPAMRRDRDAGDAEALRRRIEEPELGNAVMREVVEVRRKRPGRRPAAPVEQGEDASGRPSAPDVFTQLDDMLARHRAKQPPTATTPGSGLTDTPGRVSGWPGRSPLPRAGTGTAGSRPCSGPASRRRCSAGSWPRTVRRCMFPNDVGTAHTGGETTPAPDNLADRDFTAERPNEKWLTDITRDQGPGREVYLSPPVDCHDGGIVAYTAGSGPNAELANRMLVKAVETLPEGRGPWCIPTAAATVGGPDGWISWTVTAWRNHERIKRSLGWMSPVQYRQSQGMTA